MSIHVCMHVPLSTRGLVSMVAELYSHYLFHAVQGVLEG